MNFTSIILVLVLVLYVDQQIEYTQIRFGNSILI